LFAYSDYARATYELMKSKGDVSLADECANAYSRILNVAPSGQEIWWRAKYYLFASLYEKGVYDEAAIGLKQLKRQNPRFDGGKYNLQAKFEALETKLDSKSTGKGSGKNTKK
ncbi:MAG TPA: hypothetical protein VHF22_04840, partial [Planctomycetota bacterium]|nr:hypothetical protein [Planctomycetota bacterium]